MSEQDSPEPEPVDQADEFQPITSQEALDKLVGERIAGVKKKYADYDEIRSKATEFDKLQEASKTEVQKWEDRYNTLAGEFVQERRKVVAANKNVPAEYITGDTYEEMEASAEKFLTVLAEINKPTKSAKPTTSSALKSGATGTDSRLDPQERAAAALRAMRQQ